MADNTFIIAIEGTEQRPIKDKSFGENGGVFIGKYMDHSTIDMGEKPATVNLIASNNNMVTVHSGKDTVILTEPNKDTTIPYGNVVAAAPGGSDTFQINAENLNNWRIQAQRDKDGKIILLVDRPEASTPPAPQDGTPAKSSQNNGLVHNLLYTPPAVPNEVNIFAGFEKIKFHGHVYDLEELMKQQSPSASQSTNLTNIGAVLKNLDVRATAHQEPVAPTTKASDFFRSVQDFFGL